MIKQFYFNQFSLASIQTLLVDPSMRPYQVLRLGVRVNLGGMVMKLQSSNITGASPSDYLVSYARHSLGGVLPNCRDAVGEFYSPSRLAKRLITTASIGNGNTTNSKSRKNRKQISEEKDLYGNFRQQAGKIVHKNTWTWLRKRNLKKESEFLLTAE